MKDLHLLFLNLWNDTVLGGIAQDQPLLHRPVQGIVKHHVDAPDGTVAQSRLLAPLGFSKSPVLLEVLVHLLDLPAGEFLQLDFSDPGNDMGFNTTVIVVCGCRADIWFGIEFIPQP